MNPALCAECSGGPPLKSIRSQVETIFTSGVIPAFAIVKLLHDRTIYLILKELCLHLLACSDYSERRMLAER